jgi:hypothetical protein
VRSLEKVFDGDFLRAICESVDVPTGHEETLLVALLFVHLLHELIVSTLEVSLLLWVRVGRPEDLLSTCSGEGPNEGAWGNHGPAIQSRSMRGISPTGCRELILTLGSEERHAVLLFDWTTAIEPLEVRRDAHALV